MAVWIPKKKGTSKLRDLAREITAANLHTETDWGARRRQRTVVAREYVPVAGDLIWFDFTPQAGREQAGRRPAVVLSPRSHNEKTSLAVVCPVTSHAKGYPFEVAVPPGMEIKGVILSDHLKNLDWRQRRAQRAGRISQAVLEQVHNRIAALLQIS